MRLRHRLGFPLAVLALAGAGGLQPVAADSHEPSPAIEVRSDIEYAEAGGETLLLDAYLPPGPGPHPAVVVIHGGAFAAGDKADWEQEGMRLAQAGFAAFAVNYRLAPPGGESTFPAQLDDVRTAVRWVRANAASHRVDSRRVGTLGGSAGGNLALLLGTTGTAGDDRVEAVVSWSGPTDLRAFRGREPEILLNYMGCPMAECPDLYEQASPIAHVDRSTAPTYLANGSDELIPADQARGMDNALREAGVQSVVRIVDGEHHSRELEPFVWAASVDFLGAQLRPAPAPSQPGLLEQPLFWFVLTGAVLVGIGAMRLLARR